MIELIFVACLSAAPTTCERGALQFTDITVTACTFGAQPELARWAGEHPGWSIRRWSCRAMRLGSDA